MNHITLDQRSNEELRASIVGLHRRMCAAHRDLLAEIAEHDRRGACVDYGASSEESYLVAEFDVLWRTALDWVRTARALEHHPELGLAFAEGEISADQLGALIQVMEINKPDTTDPIGPFDGPAPDPEPAPDPPPTPDPDPAPDPDPGPSPDAAGDDEDPLQLAGRLSAAQLAAMARTLRSRSAAEAAAAHRRRRVKTYDIDGGAGVHVEADLFDDAAALFRAALDEHAKTVKADPSNKPTPTPSPKWPPPG